MSPSRDDVDTLVEATLSAYRERDRDGLPQPHAAWADLAAEERERAFVMQVEARALERLADARGWSTTVRAVLDRIHR